MNKIFILIVYVIISALSSQTFAQKHTDSNITGHVLDKSTREHLPFVNVVIKGTTIGTTTDGTGHYRLTNLPERNFTISVTHLGYKSIEKEIQIVANKTIILDFEIEPQTITMNEIVVTSNRTENERKTAPTIVNVMSDKQFELSAASNLSETMNFQSGLRVENNCSNCGVTQLRINGLDGQYSQILLDSRPLFSSLAAVYGLEQLPLAMVERIEVVRGGGSALYGSNAIGGVVNIITKEPVRNTLTLSNTTNLIGGKKIDQNTSLNGAFVSDDYKIGIFLFGQIRNRQAYDNNNDNFSDIPKINAETIGFRSYFKTSLYSKLTLEYHHINEYRRGGDNIDRPPHEALIAEQTQHKIDGIGLNFKYFSPNTKHRLEIYTSSQFIRRDSYYGTEQNLDAYGNTNDQTYIAGSQYVYSFKKCLFMPADLTVGAEFNYNSLNDKILAYNRNMLQNTYVSGVFLQNEWKNEKFSILLGGRLDKHNLVNRVVFCPRVNFRYSLIENLGLRASYSSGYRAPQAYNEDLHVEAVGGNVSLIYLDANLKPEYSHSISASADFYHKFGILETNFIVEGFYTFLNDVFALVKTGHDTVGNTLLMRTNQLGATVRGLNFEAKLGIYKRFEIQMGYTLQQSFYNEDFTWSENTLLVPQRQMFRSPNHYAYLMSNITLPKNFSISVFGNFTGKMLVQHSAGYIPDDCEKITPNFYDFGAKISYTLKLFANSTLTFNAGVKNILNSFQTDIDKGVYKDAGYVYGPSYPRTWFVGLKLGV